MEKQEFNCIPEVKPLAPVGWEEVIST